MNKKTIVLIITSLFWGSNLFAQTGIIKLSVVGINTETSNSIKIAIYDKAGFLEEMKIKREIKAFGDTAYIEFENIQVGKYAIAVFQDENLDGEMNTNFFGKPTELNGFSNNARGNFGAPDFEDAAFVIEDKKVTELKISLK